MFNPCGKESGHIVRNLLIFISPPQPFLHEMDGLSWKEQDTLLCASGVLTPQIWHISLMACSMPKLFLQSDGTGPKKASVDARLF